MMGFAQWVLYLAGMFLGNKALQEALTSSLSVPQERPFIPVNVGERVTLQCFYDGNESEWLLWYKQPLGQKPRLISTYYVFHTEETFHNEFKNNRRFSLGIEKGTHHLSISDLQISDSATYYCCTRSAFVMDFKEGQTVMVKEERLTVPPFVDQSASETIQPGGSINLTCRVQAGTCDGENRVLWFRNSAEADPGILYGSRKVESERKPNTQTNTCVYDLPLRSLKPSHAGTYYCAVVWCGHILFGNGTTLSFDNEEKSRILVYFLTGTLTLNILLVTVLIFFMHKMKKRNTLQSTESGVRFSAPSTTITECESQETDGLHYAALNNNAAKRSRTQRKNSEVECVYSSVAK